MLAFRFRFSLRGMTGGGGGGGGGCGGLDGLLFSLLLLLVLSVGIDGAAGPSKNRGDDTGEFAIPHPPLLEHYRGNKSI